MNCHSPRIIALSYEQFCGVSFNESNYIWSFGSSMRRDEDRPKDLSALHVRAGFIVEKKIPPILNVIYQTKPRFSSPKIEISLFTRDAKIINPSLVVCYINIHKATERKRKNFQLMELHPFSSLLLNLSSSDVK